MGKSSQPGAAAGLRDRFPGDFRRVGLAGADRGGGDAYSRQRGRHLADQHQAHAGLLQHRPRGLHFDGRRGLGGRGCGESGGQFGAIPSQKIHLEITWAE